MTQRQLMGISALAQRLGEENLRILDCQFDLMDVDAGRAEHLVSHIPGAVFVDLNEDLAARPGDGTGRHPLPRIENAIDLFGRLGIDQSSEVVVYDGGSGGLAARTWWMLRWLGHEKVRLLDGGFAAWKAAELPLESGAVEVRRRTFVAEVQQDRVVTSDEINAMGSRVSELNLIDARDAARFRGEHEPIDAVAGHIPGARNTPFTLSLTADGHWKECDERRQMWRERLGTKSEIDWMVMCGSGVTACHLALSAVDAGFPEPRLYVGSWSEWITDPARPIAQGEA